MNNENDFPTLPVQQNEAEGQQDTEAEHCLFCGANLSQSELFRRFRVCPECRFHHSLSARQRIALLADPGSFREVNRFLLPTDPLSFSERRAYREGIQEAQSRTGLTEAAVTGICTIGGNPTVIAVLDFAFMGGNMGGVVGEKIAQAFESAVARHIPIITIVSSGGVRMQEGVLSLMQMAKTAATAKRLHTHRLPYISVLTNPTSGEVYASFANLGDMILAEPQALLGFAPLRVVEQASGKHLSESSHTAEDHLKHGMIDQIVDRTRLRQVLSILLDLLSSPYRLTLTKKGKPYPMPDHVEEPAWQTVQLARHQMRPTALDYIVRITTSFIELHGDRHFGDDKAVVCGIAEFSGIAAIIIGQERSHNEGRCYPEGLRKAQRAMRMAAIFGLPVITLIDTPGAHPGIDAEERGIGQAIASTLALMSDLPTPMISVIIGEGGSEGALALGVTDRILMLEHAIYSAISPEQAAGIIYRDARKAEEMASALKLTALDCKDLGVIDIVVPEPEVGAHTDHDEAARLLKNVLLRQLLELQQVPRSKLVKERYKKYRRIGEYSSYFRAAFSKDISDMQDLLQRSVSRLRHHLPAGDRAKNTTEGD